MNFLQLHDVNLCLALHIHIGFGELDLLLGSQESEKKKKSLFPMINEILRMLVDRAFVL